MCHPRGGKTRFSVIFSDFQQKLVIFQPGERTFWPGCQKWLILAILAKIHHFGQVWPCSACNWLVLDRFLLKITKKWLKIVIFWPFLAFPMGFLEGFSAKMSENHCFSTLKCTFFYPQFPVWSKSPYIQGTSEMCHPGPSFRGPEWVKKGSKNTDFLTF